MQPEEIPVVLASSEDIPSSSEDNEINNLALLMPKLVDDDPFKSLMSKSLGPKIAEKRTYQRPKHDRVYRKQCDNHAEGFRGEHELRRHEDREYRGTVTKWICVEPNDGLQHPKPVLSLSRCKACHAQKKQYMAYYNAAAHLRRAHFKPKKPSRKDKDGENRRETAGGDWPPMSELKDWMKEVTEVAAPSIIPVFPEVNFETFGDIRADIDPWDLQGMESGTSLVPEVAFQDRMLYDEQGFDSFPTNSGAELDGMGYSNESIV